MRRSALVAVAAVVFLGTAAIVSTEVEADPLCLYAQVNNAGAPPSTVIDRCEPTPYREAVAGGDSHEDMQGVPPGYPNGYIVTYRVPAPEP